MSLYCNPGVPSAHPSFHPQLILNPTPPKEHKKQEDREAEEAKAFREAAREYLPKPKENAGQGKQLDEKQRLSVDAARAWLPEGAKLYVIEKEDRIRMVYTYEDGSKSYRQCTFDRLHEGFFRPHRRSWEFPQKAVGRGAWRLPPRPGLARPHRAEAGTGEAESLSAAILFPTAQHPLGFA